MGCGASVSDSIPAKEPLLQNKSQAKSNSSFSGADSHTKEVKPGRQGNESAPSPNGTNGSKRSINAKNSSSDGSYRKIVNAKCPLIRLDFRPETKVLEIQGKTHNMSIEYCYVSQRGYYPQSLNKANQDSYLVCENILGDKSCHLFGVFDGHGEYGDFCSFFAADKLPDCLLEEVKKKGGSTSVFDGDSMADVYKKAFVNTNVALHNSNIDDSLSGTTGITILQKGDRLLVANVGDSRAIIASEIGGQIKYSPLSSDQTPYRKDERERLKKAGAKIMTMDQIEGFEPVHENFGTNLGEEIDQGGDPPRVWDKTLEKPGCAFSRSIGDAVGKSVGITAEPEILEWIVKPEDKFAVIASDGVFEFITSQNVVEMIQKYDSILEAAKHVVAEAYRLWLTFDDRTDDITIIIIAFRDVKKTALSPTGGPKKHVPRERGTEIIPAINMENANRPVRKVMSKAKRKDIAEQWNDKDNIVIDFDAIENTKTEEEIARISTVFSSSFMFQNLSPIQKDHIYKVLVPRDVKANEVIIREGDEGDEMYIVDSGSYDVYKKSESGEDQKVFEYKEVGSAFGELSLMYGKPRGASVIAASDGKIWCIGRAAFRAVIMKTHSEGIMDNLRSIPFLYDRSIPEIHRLCVSAREVYFNKGDVILSESTTDSVSWTLSVVVTGVIKLIPKNSESKPELRAELSYLHCDEIGTKFSSAIADARVHISIIPKDVLRDVVGTEGESALREALMKKKAKSKRLTPFKNSVQLNDMVPLPKIMKADNLEMEYPLSFIDEIGYTGNFRDKETSSVYSVRAISKSKAMASRMDKRVLKERQILGQISSQSSTAGIPKILSVCQSDKWAYVVLDDHLICDLLLAIQSQAMVDEAKPFYAACIYSAIKKIHEVGLIHRLVNSSSIFITRSGTVKLVDYRFAKLLDGSYRYTICGDPLYFAPEIVSQQGYDYSADLWAFGILLFEMYEGSSPFGTSETEETAIFRKISGFRASKLICSKAPESARKLIGGLLQTGPEERLGYKNPNAVQQSEYFSDFDFGDLNQRPGFPVDIQPSIDIKTIFAEESILSLQFNNTFDEF